MPAASLPALTPTFVFLKLVPQTARYDSPHPFLYLEGALARAHVRVRSLGSDAAQQLENVSPEAFYDRLRRDLRQGQTCASWAQETLASQLRVPTLPDGARVGMRSEEQGRRGRPFPEQNSHEPSWTAWRRSRGFLPRSDPLPSRRGLQSALPAPSFAPHPTSSLLLPPLLTPPVPLATPRPGTASETRT